MFNYRLILLLLLPLLLLALIDPIPGKQDDIHTDWGFFAHKRINRLAVFTLPEPMLRLYKPYLEYITEHAVDPDKRRYATKYEGPRHYIDIDHWGELPFEEVPRQLDDAISKYSEVIVVSGSPDTIRAEWQFDGDTNLIADTDKLNFELSFESFAAIVAKEVMPLYYEGPVYRVDTLARLLEIDSTYSVFVIDKFSEHGTLPYNLVRYQYRLQKAFEKSDLDYILRLSAEIGHYIGDAHVPLHTTENYNGQMTGQEGIHGFWESRIPELLADDSYDYFVGKAKRIDHPRDYYWNVVMMSHSLVDSVLRVEKRLSNTFPADKQYCYVDRNYRSVLQPCPEYTEAYSDAMGGMVEDRFRSAVHAIGSSWYTAWYNAGSPDLSGLVDGSDFVSADSSSAKENDGSIQARQHWD